MKEKEIVLIGMLTIILLLSVIGVMVSSNKKEKDSSIRITRIEEIGD